MSPLFFIPVITAVILTVTTVKLAVSLQHAHRKLAEYANETALII